MTTQEGYFNLVASAAEDCFSPLTKMERDHDFIKIKVKERRVNFAHSKILKLWCDCSDNFEYDRLKKKILTHNENL